jgi:hypothetical protein
MSRFNRGKRDHWNNNNNINNINNAIYWNINPPPPKRAPLTEEEQRIIRQREEALALEQRRENERRRREMEREKTIANQERLREELRGTIRHLEEIIAKVREKFDEIRTLHVSLERNIRSSPLHTAMTSVLHKVETAMSNSRRCLAYNRIRVVRIRECIERVNGYCTDFLNLMPKIDGTIRELKALFPKTVEEQIRIEKEAGMTPNTRYLRQNSINSSVKRDLGKYRVPSNSLENLANVQRRYRARMEEEARATKVEAHVAEAVTAEEVRAVAPRVHIATPEENVPTQVVPTGNVPTQVVPTGNVPTQVVPEETENMDPTEEVPSGVNPRRFPNNRNHRPPPPDPSLSPAW